MATKSLGDYAYDEAVITVADKLSTDGASAMAAILERSRRESEERFNEMIRENRRDLHSIMGRFVAEIGVLLALLTAVMAMLKFL